MLLCSSFGFVAHRNISKLPLMFSLKAPLPFTVDRALLTLGCYEAATVNVMFEPNFRGDLQSAVIKQKLNIVYNDNPQRDNIDLVSLVT